MRGSVWLKGHEGRKEQLEMGEAGNEMVLGVRGQGKDLADSLVSCDMLYSGMHVPDPFIS